MNFFRGLLPILVIIFVSYVAVAHLLKPGLYFPVHDDTQVARVFGMAKSLSDGMFPVRWVSDLGYGYGYPIFNFYAPLAYYIGGLFALFVSALTATKIMMLIGALFAGVSMYLLSRQFWGVAGGILAAVLYMYAPYHGVNMYVRGAVSEYWAYGVLPLVFWGFYNLYLSLQATKFSNEKISNIKYQISNNLLWKWVTVSAISFATVILSHNLTAMMITPFLFGLLALFSIILIHKRKPFAIFSLLFALLLGLVLSAFYWIPAVFEMQYTNVQSQIGGAADFRDHFVCIKQLWESPMGYGGSTPTCTDGLSFKIGKIHLVLFLLSFVLPFLLSWKKERTIALRIAAGVVIISVLFMLSVSQPIWELLSPLAYLQYPWRFLALVMLGTSFAAGSLMVGFQVILKKKDDRLVSFLLLGGLVAVVVATNAEFFRPRTMDKVTSESLITKEKLHFESSKRSDEYLRKGFKKPVSANELFDEQLVFRNRDGIVDVHSQKTNYVTATVTTLEPSTLHANISYFPALRVYLDDRSTKITPVSDGMDIPVPKGVHTLRIVFEQTFIEKTANTLTFAGLVLLVLGIIRRPRKNSV